MLCVLQVLCKIYLICVHFEEVRSLKAKLEIVAGSIERLCHQHNLQPAHTSLSSLARYQKSTCCEAQDFELNGRMSSAMWEACTHSLFAEEVQEWNCATFDHPFSERMAERQLEVPYSIFYLWLQNRVPNSRNQISPGALGALRHNSVRHVGKWVAPLPGILLLWWLCWVSIQSYIAPVWDFSLAMWMISFVPT